LGGVYSPLLTLDVDKDGPVSGDGHEEESGRGSWDRRAGDGGRRRCRGRLCGNIRSRAYARSIHHIFVARAVVIEKIHSERVVCK
jgi:hypothetical protein